MRAVSEVRPVFGPTNPPPQEHTQAPRRRFASVIGLSRQKEQAYRKLHADVWPGVLERLRASHIDNYSIFVAELDGKKYLFSYFESNFLSWHDFY